MAAAAACKEPASKQSYVSVSTSAPDALSSEADMLVVKSPTPDHLRKSQW